MKPNSCGALIALFALATFATQSSARPPEGGPHPAMPHAAAPAPHPMPAPQPHFAAPPRVAAPAPHFAAPPPHVAAAPRAVPHVAAAPPRAARAIAAPRVAAAPRNLAHAAAPRGAPRHALAQMREPAPSRLARPNTTTQKINAPNAGRLDAHAPAVQPPNRLATSPPAVAGKEQREGDNSRRTVGLAPGSAQHQLSPADRQRVEAARRIPIVRNPVFASAAGGAAAASLSHATFHGAFADSHFFAGDHRHHHRFGFVLGFVGPLFWPYAYDDFVDYTFSPYAYDTFWPYAVDDVFYGIYGGYAPEYYASDNVYTYAGAPASERTYARFASSAAPAANAAVTESRICSGQAQGITDFSIDKIAQQVQPNQKQQALLGRLKDATLKAVEVLQDACPTDLPSTPTGRLDAMVTRVNAMLQAVQIVHPALDKFYVSLTDEQKEQFNALDQGAAAGPTQRSDLAKLCGARTAANTALPTERIARTLHLSADQQGDLQEVDRASAHAADVLKAKCEPDQTLTPTGRLAAIEERLTGMSQALSSTRTALAKFYGALSDEQKARFDRLPPRAA